MAVAGGKVMINYARDHTIKDALDYIAVWQVGMFSPAHMGEAFKTKAEKRDAVFPDLIPLRKGSLGGDRPHMRFACSWFNPTLTLN